MHSGWCGSEKSGDGEQRCEHIQRSKNKQSRERRRVSLREKRVSTSWDEYAGSKYPRCAKRAGSTGRMPHFGYLTASNVARYAVGKLMSATRPAPGR